MSGLADNISDWWSGLRNTIGNGITNFGNYISGRPGYGTDIIGASQNGVDLAFNPDSMLFTNEMGPSSFNISNAPDNLMLKLKNGNIMSIGDYNKMYKNEGSGFFGNGLAGLKTLADIGLGIGNYINSTRALDAAEDMYDYQKRLASVNLANQATMINNRYKTAALASAGLQGATDSQGRITTPSQSSIDAATKRAESKYVSAYV